MPFAIDKKPAMGQELDAESRVSTLKVETRFFAL